MLERFGVDDDVQGQARPKRCQCRLDLACQVQRIGIGLFLDRHDEGRLRVEAAVPPLDRRTRGDIGNMPDQHGDACSDCDHRFGEILDGMNPCSAANQELLVRSLHEAARAHGVRFGYRRCDFFKRKVIVDEAGWVDDHLVLFQVAADDCDLRDAGDR